MYLITYASGDYRDVTFPLVVEDKAETLAKAIKRAKRHTNAEFAFIWREGQATIDELVKVR